MLIPQFNDQLNMLNIMSLYMLNLNKIVSDKKISLKQIESEHKIETIDLIRN